MKELNQMIQITVNLVALMVVGLVFYLGVVSPPPAEKPNLSNISWNEELSLTDKALVGPMLTLADCKIKKYGIVKTATVTVPLSGNTIEFIGLGGKWYGND